MSKGERTGETGNPESLSASLLPSIPLSPMDWNDVDALVEGTGCLGRQLALLNTEYTERFHDLLSCYRDHIAKLVAQRRPLKIQ